MLNNNVARNQNIKGSHHIQLAYNCSKAILTKEVSFCVDGIEMVFSEGTEIVVDTVRGIACFQDQYHVDISDDEYSTIYLN